MGYLSEDQDQKVNQINVDNQEAKQQCDVDLFSFPSSSNGQPGAMCDVDKAITQKDQEIN